MAGKLYVVATPIGNLKDMTERAVSVLSEVDLIAAEDTRNTIKLLNHFDIHTPMAANHKFNEKEAVGYLVSEIMSGKDIAVVSDAGTPCVNDPGFVLVEACAEAGIEVLGVPGACAAATAISISGLPSGTFSFMGFFPREKKDAVLLFDKIRAAGPETYIFYESPKRIIDTMELINRELPDARISLCNDLTKLHERTYRGCAGDVLNELKANPNAEKGEYAFVMYYEPVKTEDSEEVVSLEAMLVDVMVKQGVTMKEAVALLAKDASNDYSKKDFYQASLNLKEMI